MRRNWLEWIVLVTSAIALAGLVGFLVVDGARDEGRPPQPVVTLDVESAYRVAAGWLLPATVTNDGDATAEAVVLRATASVGGEVEESELTVDYLPVGTAVEITFGFSDEPDGEVSVHVVGFRLP